MFVDIEQRINSRTLAVFANATALINAQEVKGIFDNLTSGADIGLAGFQSTSPQFTCASADIAGLEVDDAVVIAATSYRVAEIEPDGSGMTVLILKR